MNRLLSFFLALALAGCSSANYTIDIRDTGARGDGQSDDARAIQKAIDRCSRRGGGTVLLSGGRCYLSGPIELKSDVNFHIDAGTTLLANPDSSIYVLSAFGDNRAEGTMWIYCKDISNLSITGQGTIDGNGIAFMGPEAEDSF